MTALPALRKCPFCGTKSGFILVVQDWTATNGEKGDFAAMTYAYRCPKCGAIGAPMASEELARAAWNRRVK